MGDFQQKEKVADAERWLLGNGKIQFHWSTSFKIQFLQSWAYYSLSGKDSNYLEIINYTALLFCSSFEIEEWKITVMVNCFYEMADALFLDSSITEGSHSGKPPIQPILTCSKSMIDTQERHVEYVQS